MACDHNTHIEYVSIYTEYSYSYHIPYNFMMYNAPNIHTDTIQYNINSNASEYKLYIHYKLNSIFI